MLKLRPSCEHCDKSLPPSSTEARICSFECTFCADCVDKVLSNVCPNCGGGFVPRPIRPSRPWVNNLSVQTRPPSTERVHKPVDPQVHAALVAKIAGTPAEKR